MIRHLLSFSRCALVAFIGVLLVAGSQPVHAADREEKIVCESSRWEVRQRWDGEDRWKEELHFRKSGLTFVTLEGLSWPAVYDVSPDGQWLLRIQKIGSGESMGMLYRVEENGRVSEIAGFDDLLWSVSPVRRNQLYHTGITSAKWTDDSASLKVRLAGKADSKGKPELDAAVLYDVKTHKARRL